MTDELLSPVGAGVFNVYTGVRHSEAEPLTARLGLEPPRFCAACGRAAVRKKKKKKRKKEKKKEKAKNVTVVCENECTPPHGSAHVHAPGGNR